VKHKSNVLSRDSSGNGKEERVMKRLLQSLSRLYKAYLRLFTRQLVFSLIIAGIPVLPVYAAGTILVGQQQLASTVDSNAAGVAEAFRAIASASGTVTSLSVYVDASSNGTMLVVGIYSDKSGTPGNLLAQGSLSSPAKGSWNTVPVPNANVIAGSVYWIAILGPQNSGRLAFLSTAAGSRSETSKQSTLTTLPSAWSTGKAWSSSPASVYGSAAAAVVPILSVSPSSLIFTAVQGGSNPPPASLNVSNTGAGSLSFIGSSDSNWLSLSPLTGTAPPTQVLQVNAAVGSLAASAYTGNLTITALGAQGSPATIPVTFNVTSSTPPPPSGSDWLTYGHDPQRSGNAAGESAITPANVSTLALKWSASLDGKVTAQPLFVSATQIGGQAHDVVIAATASNSVYALDAGTGAQLWRRNFGPASRTGAVPGGFGITATPVVDRTRGFIYVVTDDGNLRTIKLADGTDASPAVPVVVNSITNPTLSNTTTNNVWGGLNLVGNNLYIATASDGNDTTPWWGRIVRVDVSAAPVLAGWFKVVPGFAIPNGGGGIWGYGGVTVDSLGRIVVATSADSTEGYSPYAGRMVVLASDLGYSTTNPLGNPLGSYEPPVPSPCVGEPGACDMDFGATPVVFQPPACQKPLAAAVKKDGKIYVLPVDDLAASATTSLQALALNNAFDGPGAGGLTGIPAYWPTGNMLYVTDGGPGINGINAGVVGLSVNCNTAPNYLQVVWSVQLAAANNQPPSPPTVANGVVFVGSGLNGSVHAYDGTNGTELWNSGGIISGATFGAPMVANGVLYVGSWNGFNSTDGGTVRAFALGTPPPPPTPTPTPPPSPTPTPTSGVLLGDQTVESALDSDTSGTAEAFPTRASTSGTVGKLSVYLDASSTATTLVAGLYGDSGGGHPGALIAQGSSSQLQAGAWNSISIPGAIVAAGTQYWIAVLSPQNASGSLKFRDGTAGCKSETSAQTNLTALPLTWVTGQIWSSCPLSAYGSTGP